MEKTGTWIWPESWSSFDIINVKSSDIEYIKSLIVGWDITELGAPTFLTKEGERLYDVFENDPQKESLLSVFVNQAILDKSITTYSNPLADENLDESIREEALYGLPSKEIKKRLLTEKNIELDINETLQKLWDDCDLNAEGFDPKRGFKLSNLQDVIDPEKKLSKSEIIKERKYYKGLLFLYLQLFVKEATLETGFYHTEDNYNWKKGKEFAAKEFSISEWGNNIGKSIYNEMEYYVELMAVVPALSRYLESKGPIDYKRVVEASSLDTFFTYSTRSSIQLEEIIIKALEYFPEQKRVTENQESYTYLLLLVRIYNAQGRFNEAQKLLQENNLDLYTENQLEFFSTLPNLCLQVIFYESCICKMGITGDYSLWKFPDTPILTDKEFEKLGIHSNDYLGSKENDRRIKRIIEERDTLGYDLRSYLDFDYLYLNSILDDLQNQGIGIEREVASLIAQIYCMRFLARNKHECIS